MEVDLLTYRLSDFMNKIAEKHMEELVKKEKIQNEMLMSQAERSRMVLNNKNNCEKKTKTASFKDIMGMKKGDRENQTIGYEEKTKTQKNLGSMFRVSRSFKSNIDKDASKGSDKVIPASKAKFLKAAKFAVMISQVKQGHDICTCSSLDATCKMHDS